MFHQCDYRQHHRHHHLHHQTELASVEHLIQGWHRTKSNRCMLQWPQRRRPEKRPMSRRKEGGIGERRVGAKYPGFFHISSASRTFVLLLFIIITTIFSPASSSSADSVQHNNQHTSNGHYRYHYLPTIRRPPTTTTTTTTSKSINYQHHQGNQFAQITGGPASSRSHQSNSASGQLHQQLHHHHHLPSLYISTASPSTMLPHSEPSSSYHQMANYSGDIMIGAVFPIHDRDQNYSCGQLQMESLQQMESLVYSLKRINDDPSILPGIKLGVLVIDSCDSPHHALEQTIDFIKSFVARTNRRLSEPEFTCTDGSPPTYKYGQFDRILGLIGGQSSEVSLQLANLLRLFKVPQVSYMSTSPTLSDKRLYEYFFRTVPSDTNQVDAIVEILKRFQWTYVSVVYSDTEYGNNGYDLLAEVAAKNSICISEPQAIDVERFVEEDYQNVIRRLMYKINARVVVVFADRVIARKLMTAAKAMLADRMDRFVWIASDAWCCRDFVVHDLEDIVEGSISVTPMSYPLKGFDAYFRQLRPETNRQNPWFEEFWQQHFSCDLVAAAGGDNDALLKNNSPTQCNSSLQLTTTTANFNSQSLQTPQPSLSPTLHFVRDAIYSFAMTFDQMHRKLCNSTPGLCEAMRQQLWEGNNLVNWLRDVRFKDEGGRLFRFLENGDAPSRYRVVNYQRLSNGSYQWKEVGTYIMNMDEQFYSSSVANSPSQILKLNQSLLRFKATQPSFPQSFCSEPCGPGQAKLKLEGDTCCWLCTNCSQYQYLPNEFTCADCPQGTLPDEEGGKRRCVPLTPLHLSLSNWWTIVSMGIATAGMLATVSTWLVFCRFAETPVIKAAGRELSHLHLAGILLSFAMTFVIISRPSPLSCSLNRFLLGFCYTVCYSAIVTKTNRIARIFRHRSTAKPRFTSPRSQLVITGLLIAIEVAINVAWILYDPPTTEFVYPARDKAVLICSGSERTSYLLGLLYPLVLIGFCTVYAFKTRKCPEGFNEARYITFTNYTTCVVWLTFLPMFVLLGTITEVRYLLICSLMSLSGTVQLSCLFVPKMYIALLKPEKNTRETVMCGGHYSRALYSNSVTTSSSATINRKGGGGGGGLANHSGGSSSAPGNLQHKSSNGNRGRHLGQGNNSAIISNEASSNSSELDTTTTTAAMHNEACKQLSSRDSQLESTSVGGESITAGGGGGEGSVYQLTSQNGGSANVLMGNSATNNPNTSSTTHNYYRPNAHKRIRSSGSTVSERALRSSSACSARSNGESACAGIGNGRREVWPGKVQQNLDSSAGVAIESFPPLHRRQISLGISSRPGTPPPLLPIPVQRSSTLLDDTASPSPPEVSPLTSPVSLLISSPPSTPPPLPLSTTTIPFTPDSPSSISPSTLRPLLTLSASPPPPSPSSPSSSSFTNGHFVLASPSRVPNGVGETIGALSSYTIDLALEQLNNNNNNNNNNNTAVCQFRGANSTSSPVLATTTTSPQRNGGLTIAVNGGTISSTKQHLRTHHTKAVLENGHERWPSVRVLQEVGASEMVAAAKTNGVSCKKR